MLLCSLTDNSTALCLCASLFLLPFVRSEPFKCKHFSHDVRLPFQIYFRLDTGTHIRIVSSDLLIESDCSDAFSFWKLLVVISGFAANFIIRTETSILSRVETEMYYWVSSGSGRRKNTKYAFNNATSNRKSYWTILDVWQQIQANGSVYRQLNWFGKCFKTSR